MAQLGDEWEHPIFGPVVVRAIETRADERLRVTSISHDGKSAVYTVLDQDQEVGPLIRRGVPTEREIIQALYDELEEREWVFNGSRAVEFSECHSCWVETSNANPREHKPDCSWKKAMEMARAYLSSSEA